MQFILKLAVALILLAAAGGLVLWFASAPRRLDDAALAAAPEGDAARGERIFWAGGCASCHAATVSEGEARLQLAGGVELATPFGTFVAPNISQHPDGIGGWSFADFANAMKRGVSPDGSHYFPAFPYTSYAKMEIADVADLFAFLQTLPPVAGEAPDHNVGFPYSARRGIGLWKLLFLNDEPVVALGDQSEAAARGRYLAEGPAHCGECHTPRNAIGGLDESRWLAGAPNPVGRGRIPNITPGGHINSWSEADIANFLETGFTPEFDSAGGRMAEVVKTLAELPAEDRAAIAAYLKAVPAISDQN
jgi:mono/diheme cytochrome c family protein